MLPYVMQVESATDTRWYRCDGDGRLLYLHRDGDLPAVVCKDGTQMWFQHNRAKRDGNKPCVVTTDGMQLWLNESGMYRRAHTKEEWQEWRENRTDWRRLYSCGQQMWLRNHRIHRDHDLPAIIYPNGTQMWFTNGQMRRDDDKPAMVIVTSKNDDRFIHVWYQDDVIARENGKPCHVSGNGTRMWFDSKGELHRDGDMPAIVFDDGSMSWRRHGKFHRDGNQPAHVMADGSQQWFTDNVFQHRVQVTNFDADSVRFAFVTAIAALASQAAATLTE